MLPRSEERPAPNQTTPLVQEQRAAAHLAATPQALLAAVVESSDDAILVKSLDGTILSWNAGAERLYGYTAAEVIDRRVALLVPPDRADEFADVMERSRRGEHVVPFETVRLHKDGRRLDVSVSISPVRNRAGVVVGAATITRDITDHKAAEAALREERDFNSAVLDTVGALVLVLDRDGRIVRFNRACERLTGYPFEEVRGRSPWGLLLLPEEAAAVRVVFEKLLMGTFPVQHENHLVTREGSRRLIAWSNTVLLDGRGAVKCVVATGINITENKQLEAQYLQAQKMEAIGRLAGGVAHDFNNLLTVINGYGGLLLDRLPRGDPARELVGQITSAGDRAASLTRQLLAFSRKAILAPQVLDLKAIVVDTEKLLRRVIGEDIDLVTAFDANLGAVKADAAQVVQCLVNLAVNARDAMPMRGKLTIEARNAVVAEAVAPGWPGARPGAYVLLAVSDTGHGMDEATRTRIFEPFFTTKPVGKGTGLGLAVVHGIVAQAGGHVQVYSEVGVGTTFKLYFPLIKELPRAGLSHAGLWVMPRGTETILLVEDEDAVRALTRHVLAGCGYTVLEARDGEEALRVAAQHGGPLQLLVTDVVLPRLGGREVAERLAALCPGVKVLFQSGYTEDAVVRHGILEAEVAFLQKPYPPAVLAQKVRAVLDATQV